jgi:hypothetical protein
MGLSAISSFALGKIFIIIRIRKKFNLFDLHNCELHTPTYPFVLDRAVSIKARLNQPLNTTQQDAINLEGYSKCPKLQ